MRTFIITCLLIITAAVKAQTSNSNVALLSKINWVQADEAPTGLDTPQDAKEIKYSSNKLAFYKSGKWGSLLNNKNEFVVGDWKVNNSQIIIYDLYAKGKGFTCQIVELTKDVLVISYVDLYNTTRIIKLIPA